MRTSPKATGTELPLLDWRPSPGSLILRLEISARAYHDSGPPSADERAALGVPDLHISPEEAKIQTRMSTVPARMAMNAPLTGNAPSRNRTAPRIPTWPSQRGNGRPRLVANPYTAKPAAKTRKPKTSTEPNPMTACATMSAAVLETPPVAYAPASTSSATASPTDATAVTAIPPRA